MSWTRRAARAAGAGVLLTAAAVQGFTRYVTRGSRQTLEEAIKWYQQVAVRKDPEAQYRLGFCYENYPEVQSYDNAAVWYRRAAERGAAA